MNKLILSIPILLFLSTNGQINQKQTNDKNSTQLSISDFGAVGNGRYDNADAIKNAVEYVISHPQKLIVPVGNFYTSHSIIARNPVAGRFFTLHLEGMLSNKSASNEYLSRITYGPKTGFAFGIQLGRSIVIENITILGQYTFPNSVTNKNIATLKFSDWIDPAITDSRYSPYAGISIDPYPTGSGGTSDVVIKNCAIKQFMVGIALSPNPSTLNDEMISILDCNVEAVRVAISIGQDQSKEIHIDRLKVWGSTHTVIDGVTYGRGTGGGSVDMYGGNIAGNVNQLLNINTDRFNFTSYGLHAESLFRIGNVGNGAGANFTNCQIDFLTGAGLPAADYILLGQANFSGGMLRYYDDSQTHRLNLCGINGIFRDMTINNLPFFTGLYGMNPAYATPRFDNIHYYYTGGKETLTKISTTSIVIDKKSWTGKVTGDMSQVKIGDYLLGSPNSTNRKYYDCPGANCNTIQIGRVTAISGNVANVDDVGLNVPIITGYDAVYFSRIKQ
jgi:hypothetical protein